MNEKYEASLANANECKVELVRMLEMCKSNEILDNLLFGKLSDALANVQKEHKINNLIQSTM